MFDTGADFTTIIFHSRFELLIGQIGYSLTVIMVLILGFILRLDCTEIEIERILAISLRFSTKNLWLSLTIGK